MNYANTLNGIENLGALHNDTSKLIKKNKSRINQILKRAEKLQGIGKLGDSGTRYRISAPSISEFTAHAMAI